MNKKIIFAGLSLVVFMAVVFSANAATTTPTIKVISPNRGEVWKAGTKKNIVFKGNLIKEPVTITIFNSSSEEGPSSIGLIGNGVTSGNGKNSTFSWFIPATIQERNDYKISISYADNSAFDTSDGFFTIKNAKSSSSSKSSRSSSSRSSKSSSSKSSSSSAKTTLLISKSGSGIVTSDDGKINCGSDCKEIYYPSDGDSIYLYANPSSGLTFNKWTGNACGDSIGMGISTSTSGAMGMCQVSLYYNSNKTIKAVAHFKKISGTGSSSSKSSRSRSSKSSSSSSR